MSLVPSFVLCDGTCAATAKAFPMQWVCLWLLTYLALYGHVGQHFASIRSLWQSKVSFIWFYSRNFVPRQTI